MQLRDNSTGHIIVEHDGELLLLDTGAGKTFHDTYRGVRVSELARVLCRPLDGVLEIRLAPGEGTAASTHRIEVSS